MRKVLGVLLFSVMLCSLAVAVVGERPVGPGRRTPLGLGDTVTPPVKIEGPEHIGGMSAPKKEIIIDVSCFYNDNREAADVRIHAIDSQGNWLKFLDSSWSADGRVTFMPKILINGSGNFRIVGYKTSHPLSDDVTPSIFGIKNIKNVKESQAVGITMKDLY